MQPGSHDRRARCSGRRRRSRLGKTRSVGLADRRARPTRPSTAESRMLAATCEILDEAQRFRSIRHGHWPKTRAVEPMKHSKLILVALVILVASIAAPTAA